MCQMSKKCHSVQIPSSHMLVDKPIRTCTFHCYMYTLNHTRIQKNNWWIYLFIIDLCVLCMFVSTCVCDTVFICGRQRRVSGS